jgi:transposase-like protein
MWKIFNIFKKKQVKPDMNDSITVQTNQVTVNKNLFHCHHCHYAFEVDVEKTFSTTANKIGGGFVQAIGIQCPECQKTCIYG